MSDVNARLGEHSGIVPVLEPKDWEAGGDGDSFDSGKAARAGILVQFGAITGDAVLTVYAGATAGTKTTALTFSYRQSAGDFKAANADQWGAVATSAALTLTAATYDHTVLEIDIPAQSGLDGKPWITLELSAAASVLLASAVAILSGPRHRPPLTAI